MADIQEFTTIAVNAFPYKLGAFYGSYQGLALGVGLIYKDVRFPIFDESANLFDTAEGLAYVLTHECDIDTANSRVFNDYLLICPIIKFDEWAADYASSFSEDGLKAIIPDLAKDHIHRVFFLPPNPPLFSHGGLLYLNQICNTHRKLFNPTGATPVCALSDYAQTKFDYKLQNHLLRSKAEILPRLTP